MLTKVLGVDIQAIFMTMLALVGLYLVITHPTALTSIIGGTWHGANDSLVILQGRSGTAGVPKGYR